MNELARLLAEVRAEEERLLAAIAPARHDAILAELGPDGVLHERRIATYRLGTGYFRAGDFERSASWFGQWRDNQRAYLSWHESAGEDEEARFDREDLARHGWATGDMDLFAEYVREGCDPVAGLRPRLDVYPALFMSWAVLRTQHHPDHWLDAFLHVEAAEREAVKSHWSRTAAPVVEAVVVDAKVARAWYWLGDEPRALEHARKAAHGLGDLATAQAEGFLLPEKRAWRNRTWGLVELLTGNPAGASRRFEKALDAEALTHGLDWKDLVLLHVTAKAWGDESAPEAVAFRAAFPQLAHVLLRQRAWR